MDRSRPRLRRKNLRKWTKIASDNDTDRGCTIFVYKKRMKNIRFSADKELIEQARQVARSQHRTLNEAFREWLVHFTSRSGRGDQVDSLMKQLRHVKAGRRFSRDEMNEH